MTYTVIGVWVDDQPTVVGVVAGQHQVSGGDEAAFPQGLWATSVDAADVDEAEQLATAEMRDSL